VNALIVLAHADWARPDGSETMSRARGDSFRLQLYDTGPAVFSVLTI